MKLKTSITLSDDLVKAIDQQSGPHGNRSEFIETAVRTYIRHILREQQNAKDLAIINRQAERLNKEASDVLSFQTIP